MTNIDRMGLLVLMSHLIITLALIAVYSYTLMSGQADETLKTILTVVVGYWFGSMGANAIKTNTNVNKDEGVNNHVENSERLSKQRNNK